MGKSTKPHIHAAIGLVFDDNGRILVSKRPNHKSFPGTWEFPGGKCHDDESPEQAVVRELDEEVGISVKRTRLFFEQPFDYPNYSIQLSFYRVEAYEGVPLSGEGQMIRWVSFETLKKLDMPEGNQAVVERL